MDPQRERTIEEGRRRTTVSMLAALLATLTVAEAKVAKVALELWSRHAGATIQAADALRGVPPTTPICDARDVAMIGALSKLRANSYLTKMATA